MTNKIIMIDQIKNSEIIQRLASDTPPFFKKVKNYAIIVGLVVPAVVGSIASAGVTIPLWVMILTGAITSICTGITGTSLLPTTDKELQERSAKANSGNK